MKKRAAIIVIIACLVLTTLAFINKIYTTSPIRPVPWINWTLPEGERIVHQDKEAIDTIDLSGNRIHRTWEEIIRKVNDAHRVPEGAGGSTKSNKYESGKTARAFLNAVFGGSIAQAQQLCVNNLANNVRSQMQAQMWIWGNDPPAWPQIAFDQASLGVTQDDNRAQVTFRLYNPEHASDNATFTLTLVKEGEDWKVSNCAH